MSRTYWPFFDLGHANQLALATVVDDNDWDQQVAFWLSGRIVGRYVSIRIPWRRRIR